MRCSVNDFVWHGRDEGMHLWGHAKHQAVVVLIYHDTACLIILWTATQTHFRASWST